MRIVLWGDRAVEFDTEAVHTVGTKEPVIIIFVGLLPKMSRGRCYQFTFFAELGLDNEMAMILC